MCYPAWHIFSTQKIFFAPFSTQKIFFAPFFDIKDTFRPKDVKIRMGSPYKKKSAWNSTSKHVLSVLTHFFDTKDIFPAFFRHKRYYFDTYRYRYRSRTRRDSSPRHKAADHTTDKPYTGPGNESSLQIVQNTPKNALFHEKSRENRTNGTLTGTGTWLIGWGLHPLGVGRRGNPRGRLGKP